MIIGKAIDFVSRYCNVGKQPEDLLREKPTLRQLAEARSQGYRYVDRMIAQLAHYHSIDWNSFLIDELVQEHFPAAAKSMAASIDKHVASMTTEEYKRVFGKEPPQNPYTGTK